MHDPQTFYVCATNTKTEGFDEHAVHRAIAFPSQCCYSCYRAMLLRDRLMALFGTVGFFAFLVMLLLFRYAEQWFTPPRVRIAIAIIAVCIIAVLFLSRRKARRVGDEKTEAKAMRLARKLDRQGKPYVYPTPKRPTARHFLILDSESDSM
jgi:hypothetical protein